jgi:hypothetical protein
MRCEADNKDSIPDIHYATTMIGFGQFGRSPGDLARWHHRLPVPRRMMAWLLGIERLNNMEYSLSLLIRFAWCALRPSAVEAVEVRMGKHIQSMPLLAGVVMNFPFNPLPFETGIRIGDAALSLNFISYPGRWASFFLLFSPRRVVRNALQTRITESDCVEIRSNRAAVEFFIDEDPVVTGERGETMTLHVCVLGIDGSGKSTITAALPNILAAELNLRAGSAGEGFRMVEADEDHLAPGFHPDGLPITGHLSEWFKRQAKRFVDNRRLYPFFKLSQMVFQDDTAYRLGRRYSADVVVSDGNVLLSAAGRVANYIHPASEGADVGVPVPDASELKAVFEYLLEGKPLRKESHAKLPHIRKARMLLRLAARFGLRAEWLPDIMIFLDLSPARAMNRIVSRGKKIDRHENGDDLAQARNMYLKTLDAFGRYRSPEVAHRLVMDNMTPGETLRAVLELLKPHILAHQRQKMTEKVPL